MSFTSLSHKYNSSPSGQFALLAVLYNGPKRCYNFCHTNSISSQRVLIFRSEERDRRTHIKNLYGTKASWWKKMSHCSSRLLFSIPNREKESSIPKILHPLDNIIVLGVFEQLRLDHLYEIWNVFGCKLRHRGDSGDKQQPTFRISLCIRKVLRGAFSEDMSIESIFSRFNFLSVWWLLKWLAKHK